MSEEIENDILPDEARVRIRYLGFTDHDAENLKRIHAIIDDDVGPISDALYNHLLSFDELKPYFQDPGLVNRLKVAQRKYLLTVGIYPETHDYIEDRLRIGATYERLKVDLQWFVGAYQKLFDEIAERVAVKTETHPLETVSLLTSLSRIFSLDMSIAMGTYHKTSTARLEALVSELRETQEALEVAAQTDALTGVSNRKHLIDSLKREIYRSKRFGHPFTLMFMDIDHFKDVNDTHGHLFGDYVLKAAATLIADSTRPSNIVGRYGGEEFAAGIIECDLENAKIVAERLRAKMDQTEFSHDGITAHVTISIGLAQLSESSDTVEDLIRDADAALYDAKETGRNKVCAHED